jgi:hypothetical protein
MIFESQFTQWLSNKCNDGLHFSSNRITIQENMPDNEETI